MAFPAPGHSRNYVSNPFGGIGMEHEIKRERVTDSIKKRREAGKDLGGRPRRVTDSQIRSAVRLVNGGEPAAQVARDFGMSRATFYRRSRALADQQGAV
jgi:DNA invertase Pin-like site-specific DNA recombinase